MRTTRTTRTTQRGAASLAVVSLLGLALLLAVGHAARQLAVEQRASASQLRATQAFEAAEAGSAWALAMLARGERVDATCTPTADPARPSFRDARLEVEPTSGTLVPRPWNDGGTLRAMHAACAWRDGAWRCSCPVDAPPALPGGDGPAFVVEVAAGPAAGLQTLVALGCTRGDGDCAAGVSGAHDAAARVESVLGLVPALRALPFAALTVQGGVGSDAAWRVRRDDAAPGGLALHAGPSAAAAPLLRLEGPAGSPRAALVADADATLAALAPDRLFARHFGVLPAAWSSRPGVARIRCGPGPCDAAVADAVAAGATMLHVGSDTVPPAAIVLRGPLALGTADRPVAVAVHGELRIDGAVTAAGFLHTDALAWTGSGGGVRGAVVVAGPVSGDGTPLVVHDGAVLERVRGATGVLAALPGSWKDFR